MATVYTFVVASAGESRAVECHVSNRNELAAVIGMVAEQAFYRKDNAAVSMHIFRTRVTHD